MIFILWQVLIHTRLTFKATNYLSSCADRSAHTYWLRLRRTGFLCIIRRHIESIWLVLTRLPHVGRQRFMPEKFTSNLSRLLIVDWFFLRNCSSFPISLCLLYWQPLQLWRYFRTWALMPYFEKCHSTNLRTVLSTSGWLRWQTQNTTASANLVSSARYSLGVALHSVSLLRVNPFAWFAALLV